MNNVELVPSPDAHQVAEKPIGNLVLTVGAEAQRRSAILDEYHKSGKALTAGATRGLAAVDGSIEQAFRLVNVQTNTGQVPSVFEYHRIIGSGTYGTVAEYRAGTEKPLAVKVCTDCEASALPIDRPLTCDVVKTVVFSGAQIQVMEMGTDLRAVPLTTTTIADFERFANSAAKCFDRTNVACADWKPDNITAFANPCGDGGGWVFRVIDVDGIVRLDTMSDGLLIGTYACATTLPWRELMALSWRGLTDENVALKVAAAHAMVNTAYAIEVSKVLFKTGSIESRSENNFLVGIREAAGDMSFAQVIDAFEAHSLPDTAVKYPQVIELLTRFRDCDGWGRYRSVYTEWFAAQSGYNWLGKRWAQKFIDLQSDA